MRPISPNSQNLFTKPKLTRTFRSEVVHFFKGLYRLRYRIYAIIVLISMVPILYASGNNIPSSVSVFGFKTLHDNPVFSTLERRDLSKFSYGDNVTALAKSFNYFDDSSLNLNDQNRAYLFGQVGLSAEEQIALAKAAPLEQLIECPANPQNIDFLRYPKYNINTPVIYSELSDLFETGEDGEIDYQSPIQEDLDAGPLSNPIQRLLVDGIVHIAFTPDPGEIGNSYIVGHSSNFASVRSDYNTIFKPIERVSKPGEEFILWDKCGRKLTFEVFEVKEILEEDVQEAYRIFPGKRVVTLQTSILEFVPGIGLYPTKRWLTRGELILNN